MSEKRVKYDRLRGDDHGVVDDVPVAADQQFMLASGKFVKLDGSKRLDIADSGDGVLFGWALVGGDLLTSGTAATTQLPVDTSSESVFELPIDEAKTEAELMLLLGETCDLVVNGSDIQQADVGESTEDVILIVGFNVARQTVYVKMNPTKMFTTGVV